MQRDFLIEAIAEKLPLLPDDLLRAVYIFTIHSIK